MFSNSFQRNLFVAQIKFHGFLNNFRITKDNYNENLIAKLKRTTTTIKPLFFTFQIPRS